MPRKMLIDTDMGSDDAVALIMALRHSDIEVIAVTTTYGNVARAQATRNALVVADLCGVSVPVHSGVERPLVRPFRDATWFHGGDGLGDLNLPEPLTPPAEEHAVNAIIAAAEQNPGLMIVTLGPLTNLALAVLQAPHIIPLIDRCVVMGGAACTYGNITPAAEYNIWCDPEAARQVFLSGLPVEMVGWEFCIGEHALSNDEIAAVNAIGTPLADFALRCNRVAIEAYHTQTREHGLSLPDPVAMAIAIDPTIATQSSLHYVEVETQSELTRGLTLVDKLDVAEDTRNRDVWAQAISAGKNVRVTWEIDIPRWKALLMACLR